MASSSSLAAKTSSNQKEGSSPFNSTIFLQTKRAGKTAHWGLPNKNTQKIRTCKQIRTPACSCRGGGVTANYVHISRSRVGRGYRNCFQSRVPTGGCKRRLRACGQALGLSSSPPTCPGSSALPPPAPRGQGGGGATQCHHRHCKGRQRRTRLRGPRGKPAPYSRASRVCCNTPAPTEERAPHTEKPCPKAGQPPSPASIRPALGWPRQILPAQNKGSVCVGGGGGGTVTPPTGNHQQGLQGGGPTWGEGDHNHPKVTPHQGRATDKPAGLGSEGWRAPVRAHGRASLEAT